MSFHIRIPSSLKFSPNKGCSYPFTLLCLIVTQLVCCLAVIMHLGKQSDLISQRDPRIGATTLLPFLMYSSCMLLVVYIFFFYLHYRGKLVPDYFTLVVLLTANGIHCGSVYVGFRPRPDLKLAIEETSNIFGLETSKVFFDPVVGGVHSVGILLNILILTLWFVGRRIRTEVRRSLKLQAQRASQMQLNLNCARGQSLAHTVFSPQQLQALRELHTSGEFDRDLEVGSPGHRSCSTANLAAKRESRISAAMNAGAGITVVTFENHLRASPLRDDDPKRRSGSIISPVSFGGSTLASPVGPVEMEKAYLAMGDGR